MAEGTVFSVKWRNEVKKITEKIVQINLSWDAYSGNATLIYLVSIKEYHEILSGPFLSRAITDKFYHVAKDI